MSTELVGQVVGFLRTVPSYPAFVVPAFRLPGKEGVWAQVVTDSEVTAFAMVLEHNELVATRSDITARTRTPQLFGFAFSETEWYCAREVSMAQYLLENKTRLAKSPYVLTEAADFYLEFFKGSQTESASKGLLDDLVARSARVTRANLMRLPRKIRGALRIDVIVAHELSPADIAHLRKSSKQVGDINVLTLSKLMQWVEGISPDNRRRWFRRAILDRFETVSHVAIVGDPTHTEEVSYLNVVVSAASESNIELKRFSSVTPLVRWLRALDEVENVPDPDKAYVAKLFGLEESARRRGLASGSSKNRP
ncbi:hypothetical protein [Burkholderia sp. 9120]|uniref:hypothetical protein n=1 Tax=Burkholderia sp. 9120 TaxID=1500897 RepID=UPI000551BD0E|nr:hypothetical protein [Burkholderia sp. 9120]